MFWQRTVKESLIYAESTINNIRKPLNALNKNLNVISVSRSFVSTASLQPNPEAVGIIR
jgi:two-component SAPR family response regulator